MGFDVFNALDLMNNKEFLEKLKFGIGDGNLQYYLYNWRCTAMEPQQVTVKQQCNLTPDIYSINYIIIYLTPYTGYYTLQSLFSCMAHVPTISCKYTLYFPINAGRAKHTFRSSSTDF